MARHSIRRVVRAAPSPALVGGAPYVPIAEFYAISDGKLVRQEVAGTYSGNGIGTPLTANVDQATATSVKATDPFEQTGTLNPPPPIGGRALVTFSNFEVIEDLPGTVANEGGQAGGNRARVSMTVTNDSAPGSGILLTSVNFQTKERALTDINDRLDGSSIEDRRDLRLDQTLEPCTSPEQTRCFDTDLGIGRFPNVIGNSLLSVKFIDDAGNPLTPSQVDGPLRFIKKNGPFTPVASGFQNFICVKSGAQDDDVEPDQDVIETCAGDPTQGLAPGQSQTVRLELDYGDFRGLILRVEPGTLEPQAAPFGLAQQGGDFDCRDQRRLPFCHPDLVGQDWFTDPVDLFDVIYVTVHQEGDAPTVMNYEANFGHILAMGGFVPSAEFSDGTSREQVVGEYCSLPGGVEGCEPAGGGDPAPEAAFSTLCVGLDCSFTDTSTGSIASWAWTFGDGASSTAQNPSHTYAAAGSYTVELTVTDDDGASDTTSQTITVNAGPGPEASFSVACTELDCSFTDTSTGSIASWDWTFGDGGGSSDQNPSHTYAAAGTYTVELTVTDAGGDSDTTSQEVTVSAGAAGISLSLSPRRVRGQHEVELTWSGAGPGQVTIDRNGSEIATVANNPGGDNTFLDRTGGRGRGTYTYQVCEAGSDVCSEEVTTTFN
jgi:PKD repeat protein